MSERSKALEISREEITSLYRSGINPIKEVARRCLDRANVFTDEEREAMAEAIRSAIVVHCDLEILVQDESARDAPRNPDSS